MRKRLLSLLLLAAAVCVVSRENDAKCCSTRWWRDERESSGRSKTRRFQRVACFRNEFIFIFFFFSTMCCCRRYSALQEQTTSGSWTWQNEQTERLALRRRHTAWNTTTSTHSTVEKGMERREREKKGYKVRDGNVSPFDLFFHLLTFPDYMNSWKHKCFM